jgi:hypothetical protein
VIIGSREQNFSYKIHTAAILFNTNHKDINRLFLPREEKGE